LRKGAATGCAGVSASCSTVLNGLVGPIRSEGRDAGRQGSGVCQGAWIRLSVACYRCGAIIYGILTMNLDS